MELAMWNDSQKERSIEDDERLLFYLAGARKDQAKGLFDPRGDQ